MNMKMTWAAVAAVGMLLAGCTQKGSDEPFEVKTFSAQDSTKYALTEIEIDYPVAGPQVLVDSVLNWLNESLGGSFSRLEDGQAMVDFYQKQSDEELKSEWDEIRADMEVDADDEESLFSIPSEGRDALKLAWQNDLFVTYDHAFSTYHTGAAHGIEGCFGTTFIKQDGSRVTWADIINTNSEDFQTILREGLKSYLDVETDADLADQLFLNEDHTVYNIPLPNMEPCVRAEGIEFYYTEYEVASYSCGTPSFIVPVSRMQPFLSERLKKLFGDQTDAKDEGFTHRTEMF